MSTNETQTTVTPSKSPIISDMYQRWILDCIIEVVQTISMDFVNRPRQYREVPPKTCEILQNFRFLTGTNPKFPNQMQRSMTFAAVLGTSHSMDITSTGNTSGMIGTGEGSQFETESARLRETARAYTERQVTQGEAQLLQAFLDEAVTLQAYLRTLDKVNNVVVIGNTQTEAIFNSAASVLRNKEVAAVFGRPPASAPSWPLDFINDDGDRQITVDDNGARLIEEIAKAFPTMLKPITQNKFGVMQRIASYGASTIAQVLSDNFTAIPKPLEDRKKLFEPVIGAAYSWKTALDATGW